MMDKRNTLFLIFIIFMVSLFPKTINANPAVPVIEGYTEQSETNPTTTITLSKPSGVQVGELLLLICINDRTSAPGFTDNKVDWNFIGSFGDTTSDSQIGLFWKIADGTEGATEDVIQQGSDEWVAWYVRISGVDTTTPINIVGSQTTGAGTSITASAVTTTIDDCLALCFGGFDGGDGYPFTVSGTGWSKEDDGQSGTSGYSDASGVWGKKSMGTAGSTLDATIGASVSDGMVGVQIAIAPTSDAGTNYIVDVSQSISSTQSVLIQVNYITIPIQSLTTSWNVLTQWDIIANLVQPITGSWSVVSSLNMFVILSQSLTSVWQTVLEWDASIGLTQTLSTSWSVLIQTTFNVIGSLSNTFSWIVDVVHSIAGINHIVDLTQSVSTSWIVLTQTTFNVVTSLSNTFSWIVDIIQSVAGINHIIDLTQSISTSWIVDAFKGVQHSVSLSISITSSWIVDVHNLDPASGSSSGISLLLIVTILFTTLTIMMRKR